MAAIAQDECPAWLLYGTLPLAATIAPRINFVACLEEKSALLQQ
ncbi:MAG: hypothetical protein NT075_14125 [Chloroflexi bacterium]|nr:hypothetical protein [Chloroflexota bacterium]